MSGNKRFQYSLQPVLLKRQWDHDALLAELQEINSELAISHRKLHSIQSNFESASSNWNQQSSGYLAVGSFIVLTRYMQDLSSQKFAVENDIKSQETQRDLLIERIVISQKEVDAVEDHRDEMLINFKKLRSSEEFKNADDHWSTLQASRLKNDNSI